MNVLESIGTALRNVFSNKMRSLLTALGIIIGIGSVIAILAVGEGSRAQMDQQFEDMGVNQLTVMLSYNETISQKDLLNQRDLDMINFMPGVKQAGGTYSIRGVEVKLLDPTETKRATLQGVTDGFDQLDNPTMLHGRYINQFDILDGARVAVIQDSLADSVFGYSDERALGQTISVKTWRGVYKFTIIGISENPNKEMELRFDANFPTTVTLPISTAQRMAGAKEISEIKVAVIDKNNSTALADQIVALLEQVHENTDKYYVQNMAGMLDQVNTMMNMVTLVIAGIAGISLLVGGIGVMNIMLVTVTERTREIGIRKSIGARNKDIRTQFLIEAVILTAIGGSIGVVLGWGLGNLIGRIADVAPVITVESILLAVGISSAVGIIFGVNPASKAAKLDPIEALRYE